VTEVEGGLLFAVRSNCCLNNACDLVTMVAISYLRSWTRAERSSVFWLMWLCLVKLLASVSMALDFGVWGVVRDVIACLICSTAIAMIVFNWAISCFNESSSVEYPEVSCAVVFVSVISVDCMLFVELLGLLEGGVAGAFLTSGGYSDDWSKS